VVAANLGGIAAIIVACGIAVAAIICAIGWAGSVQPEPKAKKQPDENDDELAQRRSS
jgi:hypothetical protein